MSENSLIAQDFKMLEEKLLDPKVRKSAVDLALLLADEFVEFGCSGRVYNKQQVIESLINEKAISLSLKDFRQMQLATGLVLVTYTAEQRKSSDDIVVCSLRSSIWKLVSDRWQMLFHQGTISTFANPH